MSDQREWRPRHNPWVITLTVTLATFMEVLDTSIANVALPHIAGSFSASEHEATWVLSSYLVANAVVLPMSAWISSRVGRKRFYMTCVVLFTASSFLCGIAPSLPMLIFFRILQGIGGGGLAPSEQAILADTFEPARRGVAFAVYGMAVVLAPAIGPTVGGWITDNYSWHWIFFINVPVGILSLFLTANILEDPPHVTAQIAKSRATSIDYVGAFLVAVGFGSLEVVLDKGQEDDWFSSSFILGFAITSAIAIAAFIVWEWNEEHPILNIRLFKVRSFAAASILMLALGGTLYGSTTLQPQYLQTVMGYTAELAGKTLMPGGFTVLLCMPLVGRLVSRSDSRRLAAFGFTVAGFALFHMSTLYLGIDMKTAILYRVFLSIGIAFLFVPINTISFVGVPREQNGQVSSVINLCRNLGGSIGISAVSTLLAQRSQVHQSFLVAQASASSPAFRSELNSLAARISHAGAGPVEGLRQAYGQIYQQILQQATVLAYIDALRVLGITCLLAIPFCFFASKPKPGGPMAAH